MCRSCHVVAIVTWEINTRGSGYLHECRSRWNIYSFLSRDLESQSVFFVVYWCRVPLSLRRPMTLTAAHIIVLSLKCSGFLWLNWITHNFLNHSHYFFFIHIANFSIQNRYNKQWTNVQTTSVILWLTKTLMCHYGHLCHTYTDTVGSITLLPRLVQHWIFSDSFPPFSFSFSFFFYSLCGSHTHSCMPSLIPSAAHLWIGPPIQCQTSISILWFEVTAIGTQKHLLRICNQELRQK